MTRRDKHIIAFGTHTNAFAGNIKALLLEESSARFKKVFIGKTQELTNKAQSLGVESYWRYSPKGIWYSLRADIYIYSSYPSDINFWLSAGVKYVSVWHGTPLKKIERDVESGYYSLRNRYKWLFHIIAPYQLIKPDLLLVASPYEKECFSSAFDVNNSLFLELFPPRLNALLAPSQKEDDGYTTLLYAPTWRDDHSFEIENSTDIGMLDEFLIAHNLHIYCKPHPSDQSDYSGLKQAQNISLASKDDDIYTLLAKCDILITDYSSMLFEALYLNKAVVLFCPDYEIYQSTSRTFYRDPCRDMGLVVTEDTGSLMKAIEERLKSDSPSSTLPKAMKPYNLSHNIVEKIYQKVNSDV